MIPDRVISPLERSWFGWHRPIRILLIVCVLCAAVSSLWGSRGHVPRSGSLPEFVLDPNTAPPEALLALPKLGPALVARIVEAREVRPFVSLGDFDKRVRGIGPATMTLLRPHLKIINEPLNERRAEQENAP